LGPAEDTLQIFEDKVDGGNFLLGSEKYIGLRIGGISASVG